MSKWIEVKLKDVCERITVGHVGSMADQYKATGIPFLRSLNIKPYRIDVINLKFIDEQFNQKLKKTILKTNDVAIVRTGYPGTACVVPRSLGIANCSDLVIVRPGKHLNSYFLAAIFNSTFGKDLVAGNLVRSAQQHFNITVAKELKLRLPPKSLQDKISAVLSTYDDLIENNDRRITLLEKMAEEIYREWFVRLRFPGHEQVASHKGIPEDWESKRFDEFCLLQRGFDLPDDKVKPGIYPVVASTSIKTYHSEPKVNPPVITTGRSGSLGTVLFVNSSAWPLNTTLFVKNFFGNSPYLIYYTLKFLKLENFNAGAGVPSLNRNHLGGLHMSVPPKILQNRFDENISIIFKQKENLANANEKLKQTRDRLLTRLISGKLSVEDLDIQFPPSMTEALEAKQT
jgi:type I restriction enzyme, S subunit